MQSIKKRKVAKSFFSKSKHKKFLKKKYRRFTKKTKFTKNNNFKKEIWKKKRKEQKKKQNPFFVFPAIKNQKYVYLQFKINWVVQKLLCRLMHGGNKYSIEKKLFDVCKPGLIKRKTYNFSTSFFLEFFEKLKRFRPRIEICKRKRRKGKTSALAKERLRRTKTNRFLIPNCMSRQKQLRTVIAWIINEIKITGLRKLKVEKPEIRDASKKIRPKNLVKGRKNLLMAIKAAKKKRQLEKLQIKEKTIFKVYPLKKKIKKVFIDIFLINKKNSLLFNKLNSYVELLGIQAGVPGLRRWK